MDVCTSPQKKLPDTGTLYLIKDFSIPKPGSIVPEMVIKKSDPNSSKPEGTYASIVNGDFDKVHAVMELNLGSSILKLDDGTGKNKSGDVIATITADFDKWVDWIGNVKLPPFQLPLLKGVTFSGTNIAYDHSDKINPPGFNLPAEYTGETGVTWHGIYFNQLTVELPSSLKSNPRIGVMVQGGILDSGAKFTGHITPAPKNKPVLDYTNGSLAGFGFSIDDVDWLIVQNSNKGGSFIGKLQFPISDSFFSYTCNLSGGFDALQFTTKPAPDYTIPLFAANMNLNQNTSIQITHPANQTTSVTMSLCGQVAINVQKFAGTGTVGNTLNALLPKLCFEKFTVANTPVNGATPLGSSGLFLSTGSWNLSPTCAAGLGAGTPTPGKGGSGPEPPTYEPGWPTPPDEKPTGSLGGFPINFDTPTIVSTKEGAGIRFGIGLHLGDGDDDKNFIQAKGTVDFLGTVTTESGRFKPAYVGTYPRSLSINGAIGPLTVKGGVAFFNQDTKYGNGIKGNAAVTLPGISVNLKMAMLFGNVNGFKYGFVDGSVQFGTGIPLVGPAVLTGLGGGMHYNMALGTAAANIASLPKPTADNKDPLPAVDLSNPGKTLSGQTYSPQKGDWGFTAKIYAGLADPKVFNSSLALTINFSHGSMGGFNLHGNANVMSKTGDGDGADGIAHAAMDITYDYSKKVLDASIGIDATFMAMQTHVPFLLHVSNGDDWCIKLGDPADEGNRVKVTFLNTGNNDSAIQAYLAASAYMATGSGPSLGGLPPVPKEVNDFLTDTNSNTLPEAKTAFNQRAMPSLTPIGNDFKLLLGGRLDGNLKVQVQPFRLWAKATIGFDVALAKNMTCGGSNATPAGLNGWYGQGQAYAYFGGGIDLYVDVWFFSGSVNLMTLEAGALLQAGFPDPTWADGKVKVKGEVLDGLISVETTQNFAFGDKCMPVYNGDPLKDLAIISEMTPTMARPTSRPCLRWQLPLICQWTKPLRFTFRVMTSGTTYSSPANPFFW
ncbi:hypothetical protein GO730_20080 [Spirosoma sp. HMF3257]|uniref:Uncharacterized protein n=1 Tax=Spirosoma telluris TaxID=2183553 RepID=A0A327NPD9_9BACT|nr:hypothetical protein [Spirosoma telluris]RAI75876.1 hypothetical protein HMF3257_20005 [Spirosoma telluris]